MLTNYFIVLYISHAASGLVIFDVQEGILEIIYGNTDIILYLKTIDVFYTYKGDKSYCDRNLAANDPNRFCDLEVHSQICIMRQEFIGKRTPYDYANKSTFEVDKNRLYTHYKENQIEFNCGEIKNFTFDQQNAIYLFEPYLLQISNFTAPFSTIFKITAYVGDGNFFGRYGYESFGRYNTYVYAGRTRIQESIYFNKMTKIPILRTTMYEEYMVRAKCSQSFYGRTCWYKCVDNLRIKCNCKEMEVYSNVPCLSTCVKGWLAHYVVYNIQNIAETVTNCDTMDICVHDLRPSYVKCGASEMCLPVDNKTFFCELLYVSFQTKLIRGNLTSEVFLYRESIFVDLERSLLKKKDVGVNSSADMNIMDFVFGRKLLIYKRGVDKAGFMVRESKSVDIPYVLSVIINLKAWDYYITRTRTFRIYVPPYMINMYHYEDFSYMSTYGYLGESLFGNSTAEPNYKSLFEWKSLTVNFSFHWGNIVEIPNNTFLGIHFVSCQAALLIEDRNSSMTRKYTIFIKPFKVLEWNTTSNVLEFNTSVKCLAVAIIPFKLSIVQLEGQSNIPSVDNVISLRNVVGGLYSFVCNFHADMGLQYSTYLKFKLRIQATKVCLFLFANVMGSLVQCGHNGYLQDEYYIRVQLLTFNSIEWVIQTQGSRYVRIPYEMKLLKYKIKCTVTNTVNKIELYHETDDKLYTETRRKYYLTDMNRLCLQYEEYIEIPLVSKFELDSVTLAHKIFYFMPNDFGNPFEIPLCVLLSTFPFCAFGLLIHFLLKISDQESLMEKHTKTVIKQLKNRKLNDKLREVARRSLRAERESIKDYFKTTRDSKRISVFQALDKL